MVSARWERDWHHYLTCSLKYIVVVVDGRGTGFKGRKLRNPVRKNLGEYEVKDQLNAARIWASKRYVDARRIGIWGWVCAILRCKRGVLIVSLGPFQSYGGFMSSKVVEANAGVYSLAMAVAVRGLVPLPVELPTDRTRTARYKLEALWLVYFLLERESRERPFSSHLGRLDIHRTVYGHPAE